MVSLLPISTWGYDENQPQQHLHGNQPLNNHGGAKLKTTWCLMTASFLLAQS